MARDGGFLNCRLAVDGAGMKWECPLRVKVDVRRDDGRNAHSTIIDRAQNIDRMQKPSGQEPSKYKLLEFPPKLSVSSKRILHF
jgi:hypothetical protein